MSPTAVGNYRLALKYSLDNRFRQQNHFGHLIHGFGETMAGQLKPPITPPLIDIGFIFPNPFQLPNSSRELVEEDHPVDIACARREGRLQGIE